MKDDILPKLIGAETEYACAMIEPRRKGQRSYVAAVSSILQHCDHYRPERFFGGYGPGWQREFLINGARLYRDHEHVEYSTPESLSARTLVACVKAGDAIVNDARTLANQKLHDVDGQIIVVANNSDGKGHSYAGHLNVLLARKAFARLFRRSPQLLFSGWVPHLVTSQVYTGAGKVGSEKGGKRIRYQLSQRADFIQQVGPRMQTTYDRPLVNSRDEALADSSRFARLHIITFDSNMMEFALWLKFGTVQIVLAMLEADYVPRDLTLRDPVGSIRLVSRDLRMRSELELQSGHRLTALEIQEEILAAARKFAAGGKLDGIVPEYERLLDVWEETINQLKKNPYQLYRRIDWVAKLMIISRYRKRQNIAWNDPALKKLDIEYANIDPSAGLYSTVYQRTGLADRVVTEGDIARLIDEAPSDTRARVRSALLRRYGEYVDRVDWNWIDFRGNGSFSKIWQLRLDDPLDFNKGRASVLPDDGADWEETVRSLGAEPARTSVVVSGWWC